MVELFEGPETQQTTRDQLQFVVAEDMGQGIEPVLKLSELKPLKHWWQEQGLKPELLDTLVQNLEYMDRDLFKRTIVKMADDIKKFASEGKVVVSYLGGRRGQKVSGDFIIENLRPHLEDCKDIEYVNIGDWDQAVELNTRAMQGKVSRLAYVDDWALTGLQFALEFSKTAGLGEYLDPVQKKRAFFIASTTTADREMRRKVEEQQLGWEVNHYITTKTVEDILPSEDIKYLQKKVPDAAGWTGWASSVMTFSFWKAPDNLPRLFTGYGDYLDELGLKPIIDIVPPYYRQSDKE